MRTVQVILLSLLLIFVTMSLPVFFASLSGGFTVPARSPAPPETVSIDDSMRLVHSDPLLVSAKPDSPTLVSSKPKTKVIPDIHLGEAAFARNCAPCHQPGGVGKVGLAPSIRNRDFLALASDDFIRQTVSAGRPGTAMVARPDLNGAFMTHIIAYLRDLEVALPVEVSIDRKRKSSGDVAAGAETYAIYCASCHGPRGEGYSAGGSGPGIGLPGFLSTASDDYIFQTVKRGRIGTPMRPFIGPAGLANLEESDVHDVIVFLRKNSGSAGPAVASTAGHSVQGDPVEGEKIFTLNCMPCHQSGGVGKIGLAPSIRNRDFLAIASDEFIRQTIKTGRLGTAMIPRVDLVGAPTEHIIAYLRALPIANPVEVTVDPNRTLPGDAALGAEKFAVFCASCHGPKGEGYMSGGSGTGIGLPGFLSVASDDFILQTLILGRVGTAMMPFVGPAGLANLTEEDAGDIIKYLRSLN